MEEVALESKDLDNFEHMKGVNNGHYAQASYRHQLPKIPTVSYSRSKTSLAPKSTMGSSTSSPTTPGEMPRRITIPSLELVSPVKSTRLPAKKVQEKRKFRRNSNQPSSLDTSAMSCLNSKQISAARDDCTVGDKSLLKVLKQRDKCGTIDHNIISSQIHEEAEECQYNMFEEFLRDDETTDGGGASVIDDVAAGLIIGYHPLSTEEREADETLPKLSPILQGINNYEESEDHMACYLHIKELEKFIATDSTSDKVQMPRKGKDKSEKSNNKKKKPSFVERRYQPCRAAAVQGRKNAETKKGNGDKLKIVPMQKKTKKTGKHSAAAVSEPSAKQTKLLSTTANVITFLDTMLCAKTEAKVTKSEILQKQGGQRKKERKSSSSNAIMKSKPLAKTSTPEKRRQSKNILSTKKQSTNNLLDNSKISHQQIIVEDTHASSAAKRKKNQLQSVPKAHSKRSDAASTSSNSVRKSVRTCDTESQTEPVMVVVGEVQQILTKLKELAADSSSVYISPDCIMVIDIDPDYVDPASGYLPDMICWGSLPMIKTTKKKPRAPRRPMISGDGSADGVPRKRGRPRKDDSTSVEKTMSTLTKKLDYQKQIMAIEKAAQKTNSYQLHKIRTKSTEEANLIRYLGQSSSSSVVPAPNLMTKVYSSYAPIAPPHKKRIKVEKESAACSGTLSNMHDSSHPNKVSENSATLCADGSQSLSITPVSQPDAPLSAEFVSQGQGGLKSVVQSSSQCDEYGDPIVDLTIDDDDDDDYYYEYDDDDDDISVVSEVKDVDEQVSQTNEQMKADTDSEQKEVVKLSVGQTTTSLGPFSSYQSTSRTSLLQQNSSNKNDQSLRDQGGRVNDSRERDVVVMMNVSVTKPEELKEPVTEALPMGTKIKEEKSNDDYAESRSHNDRKRPSTRGRCKMPRFAYTLVPLAPSGTKVRISDEPPTIFSDNEDEREDGNKNSVPCAGKDVIQSTNLPVSVAGSGTAMSKVESRASVKLSSPAASRRGGVSIGVLQLGQDRRGGRRGGKGVMSQIGETETSATTIAMKGIKPFKAVGATSGVAPDLPRVHESDEFSRTLWEGSSLSRSPISACFRARKVGNRGRRP